MNKEFSIKRILKWTGLSILGIIVIMVVVGLSSDSSDSQKNNTVTQTQEDNSIKERKTISIVFAEKIIKNNLKSPSTAKFVDVDAYELSNEKDVWAVNGYVDSQNSFGAMIRSQWEVQVDYSNGKTGVVKSVFIDGEKIQ